MDKEKRIKPINVGLFRRFYTVETTYDPCICFSYGNIDKEKMVMFRAKDRKQWEKLKVWMDKAFDRIDHATYMAESLKFNLTKDEYIKRFQLESNMESRQ